MIVDHDPGDEDDRQRLIDEAIGLVEFLGYVGHMEGERVVRARDRIIAEQARRERSRP